jgi:hypothetical protein
MPVNPSTGWRGIMALVSFADDLDDWTYWDGAAYVLGRTLGLFHDADFLGVKHAFWTDNQLGNGLHDACSRWSLPAYSNVVKSPTSSSAGAVIVTVCSTVRDRTRDSRHVRVWPALSGAEGHGAWLV